MLVAKNVYGLALVARGHLEATAVLAYFCDRIDALSKDNIKFEKFEWDVAVNGRYGGAKHELFAKANSPQNIMACIEKGDRFVNNVVFGKKVGLLSDCYSWLSEFATRIFVQTKAPSISIKRAVTLFFGTTMIYKRLIFSFSAICSLARHFFQNCLIRSV